MKISSVAAFLLIALFSSVRIASAEEPQYPMPLPPPQKQLSALAPETTQSLLRQFPAGGDGLTERVSDILTRDPTGAASQVADLGNGCNCDQATAIALGVARATKLLQQTSPQSLKPMFQTLAQSCSGCRRHIVKGPARPEDLRCEGDPSRQRLADVMKVRAPQGKDCLCALLSSLAAQALAQGLAGGGMGFFPDEGGFTGGGIAIGAGFPVSQN